MTKTEALQVMGLKEGYSEEELKKRYRELIKKWHPDINPSPEAEAMTQRINEAQTLLKADVGKCVSSEDMPFMHSSFFDIKRMFKTETGSEGLNFKHNSFFDIACTNI